MTAGPEILVTIAVLTFRRPDDLAELLPLLLAQAAENDGAGRRVDVLVVDNDAAAGGRPVVAALGDERIRYVVEETPGISAARNRALEEAGGAFLVFIDDDERPHPGWLATTPGHPVPHLRRGGRRCGRLRLRRRPRPVGRGRRFLRPARLATGTPIDGGAPRTTCCSTSRSSAPPGSASTADSDSPAAATRCSPGS